MKFFICIEKIRSLITCAGAGNRTGDEGCQALTDAIKNNKSLRRIDLSCENIEDPPCASKHYFLFEGLFAQILISMHVYAACSFGDAVSTEVELRCGCACAGVQLGAEGCKALTACLEQNQTLAELILYCALRRFDVHRSDREESVRTCANLDAAH
eukprot:6214274-Pleurochrysis_carterae.AAC.2